MYIKSAASRFPVIVFDLCSFYRLVYSLVVQDLGFYTRSRFLVASLLGMTKPLLPSASPAVQSCLCPGFGMGLTVHCLPFTHLTLRVTSYESRFLPSRI